jgi:hypothetical protein
MASPMPQQSCSFLSPDAERWDGLPFGRSRFSIRKLRLAFGGFLVGGSVGLSRDRLTLEPNMLLFSLPDEVGAVRLPLADITDLRRRFGVLSDVIVLKTNMRLRWPRCWGEKAFAGLIAEVRRRCQRAGGT